MLSSIQLVTLVFIISVNVGLFHELRSMKNEASQREVWLPNGPTLSFATAASSSTLRKWATLLTKSNLEVSHNDAVFRERYVVAQVESGAWPAAAYHEYQRMAAVTGNVDSIRLLLQYGVLQSLQEVLMEDPSSELGRLFAAAYRCTPKLLSDMLPEWIGPGSPTLSDGTNLWMAAAVTGCEAAIDILQSSGDSSVNDVGLHGLNALMVATGVGKAAMVSRLLSIPDVDANARHKFAGSAAIHFAAEVNRSSIIRILCASSQVDSILKTSTGSLPIHVAAFTGGGHDTITALVNNCGQDANGLMNNDTTPLYLAAQLGHVETIRALIANGALPDKAMPTEADARERRALIPADKAKARSTPAVNAAAANGASPLHAATENGHHDAVAALLELGANPDSVSIGVTALHLAAQYNRFAEAKVLLKMGASVDVTSPLDGATPLCHAVLWSHLKVASLLMRAGASLGSPLLWSAASDVTGMGTKFLLRAGANANERESDAVGGRTALMVAAAAANADAMQWLLQAGADISATDKSGETVFHMAANRGDDKIVKLLLSALRSISKEHLLVAINKKGGVDGATPLSLAARNGHSTVVEQLINKGGDVHILLNDRGRASIIYLAVVSGNRRTVSLLLDAGANPNLSLMEDTGATPLLAAIDRGYLDIVQELIYNRTAKGDRLIADINLGATGTHWMMKSPLLLAVIRGNQAIVEGLLYAGASCQVLVAAKGESRPLTLLEIASQRRDYDTVQVLSKYIECDPDTLSDASLKSTLMALN